MQPLVVAPHMITVSTPCETRTEGRFVPKKAEAPFLRITVSSSLRSRRGSISTHLLPMISSPSPGAFSSQSEPSFRFGSNPMMVKMTGISRSRAAARRRFVASTSRVSSEPIVDSGSVKPRLKSTTRTAGRAPRVTLCPRRARSYISRVSSLIDSPHACRSLPGSPGKLLAEAGALHELAGAGLPDELVALDDDLSPDKHDLRGATHFRPLEEVVVHVRVVRLGGDLHLLLGVENDDVGVASDRDRALPGVHAEELGRVGGDELDEPAQRDTTLPHAEVMEHVQAILDPRPAVWDLGEVVPAQGLLAVPVERAVVGRDNGEDVRGERVPEVLLVLLRSRRRRVDVLGPLEVRLVQRRLVDKEVLGTGLAPGVPVVGARLRYRVYGLLAGDVDDVERRSRDAGELNRPVCRLTLRDRRTRCGVPLRLGLPLRKRLLDEDVDGVAVLGVNHHERPRLGRDLHCPEERLVVNHDRALVRHEELVARHPLIRRLLEVFERPAFLEVSDRQVEADVDHRLGAFDLLVPRRQRVREALARLLQTEVDVARRAAEGGRDRPRGEVVAGDRPAERHLHVGVRVDRARDDVLAARVDHLVGLHVERLPDEGDPLVLDEYVPHVVVGGGNDTAALDQYGHALLALLSTNNPQFSP